MYFNDRFYVKHMFPVHELKTVVDDVKTFLKNTRELVIFNIQKGPDYSDKALNEKRQRGLVHLLATEFNSWLVKPGSKGWDTKMKEIWEKKDNRVAEQGRIIIIFSYSDWAYTKYSSYFFPIPKENWSAFSWANTKEPCELVESLDNKVSITREGTNIPWIMQGQMTPPTAEVIASFSPAVNAFSSVNLNLRYYAVRSNRLITAYLRSEWSDLKSVFVIADFIVGSNIIDETIKMNLPKNEKIHFIKPQNYHGYGGEWGELKKCQSGSFVTSVSLKIESKQGGGDDTALNDIRMECTDLKTNLTTNSFSSPNPGPWGDWGEKCTNINGFSAVKIRQEKCGFWCSDGTAANGLRFRKKGDCEGSCWINPGDGFWGDWSSVKECPEGMVITGMKTKVMAVSSSEDNETITEVEFLCSTIVRS